MVYLWSCIRNEDLRVTKLIRFNVISFGIMNNNWNMKLNANRVIFHGLVLLHGDETVSARATACIIRKSWGCDSITIIHATKEGACDRDTCGCLCQSAILICCNIIAVWLESNTNHRWWCWSGCSDYSITSKDPTQQVSACTRIRYGNARALCDDTYISNIWQW